jgi:hypothetical protein
VVSFKFICNVFNLGFILLRSIFRHQNLNFPILKNKVETHSNIFKKFTNIVKKYFFSTEEQNLQNSQKVLFFPRVTKSTK